MVQCRVNSAAIKPFSVGQRRRWTKAIVQGCFAGMHLRQTLLKMCLFVKCLFSIKVSLNCVRGGCSQTQDIIVKKCFMISLIESQPICLLILICSKMWQWSSVQWGRSTREYLCLHVPSSSLRHADLAPQSEAQHFHLVYLPHISLKGRHSEPSLCPCFIQRAWTYLLLSVWNSKQRGMKAICTMAHNGFIAGDNYPWL